jgi:IS4 transposase
MPFKTTTFSHLLKFIPKEKFQQCVDRYQGDRYTKKFSCWSQFVSILYLQITGKRSLRELSASFNSHENTRYHLNCGPIKRSTLSDANDKRDYRIYQDLLSLLIKNSIKTVRTPLEQAIHVFDSTFISLHKTLNAWASQGHRVYGIKAQVVYSCDHELPLQLEITHANINDPFLFERLKPEKNVLYLFDRGYWDFKGWRKILSHQADFLTRTKSLMTYRPLKSLPLVSKEILSDQLIQLTSKRAIPVLGNQCLRLIVALDHQGRKIELITSKLHETASYLVELYRRRWTIEIFFKWIKQNLKVKRYIGQSENAVRIQLIIAIIAFILSKSCHAFAQPSFPLRYFLSLLGEHLMRPLSRKIFDPPLNLKNLIINQWNAS